VFAERELTCSAPPYRLGVSSVRRKLTGRRSGVSSSGAVDTPTVAQAHARVVCSLTADRTRFGRVVLLGGRHADGARCSLGVSSVH
jgi:hypothetical protein